MISTKEFYKNPIFYYVLVPICMGLWPLLVWGVYLPHAQDKFEEDMQDFKKAEALIGEILNLDQERLGAGSDDKMGSEFDYATVIDRVANQCGISVVNYKINTGKMITSGGEKSQSAKVLLKEVDIKSFSNFLSTLQLRWASLQCTQVKLTKLKGKKDAWKIDLDFKYYF